jgi:hypothetical protein
MRARERPCRQCSGLPPGCVSRPRASAVAASRTPPARHTSTSTCRTRRADPVAAAHIRRRHPAFLLLRDRNDLLFAEPAPLHIRPTPSRRTLLKHRSHFREHVNRYAPGGRISCRRRTADRENLAPCGLAYQLEIEPESDTISLRFGRRIRRANRARLFECAISIFSICKIFAPYLE